MKQPFRLRRSRLSISITAGRGGLETASQIWRSAPPSTSAGFPACYDFYWPMSPDATAGTTQLLLAWSQGDEDAREQLLPFVYDELKKLARGQMRRERSNHTLEVTGLVHEVYLLMIDQKRVSWQNRAHFFGIAAQMMRRVLVNHAVARQAQKRGGKRQQITLREDAAVNEQRSVDLLTLDQALKELESLDPRQCRVVELRYFAGLSNEEMAEALGISLATVKREWATARLWLHRRIRGKVEDET